MYVYKLNSQYVFTYGHEKGNKNTMCAMGSLTVSDVYTMLVPRRELYSGLKEDFSEALQTHNPIPCRESYALAAKQQNTGKKKIKILEHFVFHTTSYLRDYEKPKPTVVTPYYTYYSKYNL